MIDVLARRFPALFGTAVRREVEAATRSGVLRNPNLRYAGSGEVTKDHLPALRQIKDGGVWLWGFTRSLQVARALQQEHIAVLFSCDRSTAPATLMGARDAGLPLAYSSDGVDDMPPPDTVVTFPVHRVGRVREVVDVASLCPKVLLEYLDDTRPEGMCQTACSRCHRPAEC
jgi:hypothetical protein